MNKNVKAAIRLLSKAPHRVRIGAHEIQDCPIATGYRVRAVSYWQDCLGEDMTTLRSYGWNGRIYNSFLEWYDARDRIDMDEHEFQLRKLLIIVKKKVRKEVRRRHRQRRRMVVIA